MSQHLVDSGQRVAADRENDHVNAQNGGTGNGSSRHHQGYGGNGGGNGNGAASRTGAAGAAGSAGQDTTLDALDALSRALREMAQDHELLEQRLKELHRQRSEGKAWRDILAEEDAPGTMQVVSRMLAVLAKASGTLRKELVDSLRREGVSIPAIAKLFGVTHQRVSNLLRRPAE